MKTRSRIAGLLALNVALLAVLALLTLGPKVTAQPAGPGAAGDYIMVGGDVSGQTANAVYVLDQRSGVLVGMVFEQSSRRMKGIGVRNVGVDARRAGESR